MLQGTMSLFDVPLSGAILRRPVLEARGKAKVRGPARLWTPGYALRLIAMTLAGRETT